VIDLCKLALGWNSGDPNEEFFRWKHLENAFGNSPIWVAEEDGRLIGARVFLRWRFIEPGRGTVEAVRAVDTATHPEAQGRGIFTRLTTAALPELLDMGVGMVFNTPNDKSRPGYLKMGWSQVGRVPISARVASPTTFLRMAGAKSAAEKWSQPCSVGLDPSVAFSDDAETERLLRRAAPATGIATVRSPEYLRWRFGFTPLQYRVLPISNTLDDGVVVFRVRRRGSALELTIADVIAPRGTSVRRTIAEALTQTGADYALATSRGMLAAGLVPAPRLGPILTWLPLGRPGIPAISDLGLTMSDIELF
jgi:GNAT superfamily N-acetyltransferase